jgi:guanylate kinase
MLSNKLPHYIVISSPSGGGKTTLIRRLLKDRTDLKLSISYTTRPSRKGEVDGVDYRFISEEEFRNKIAEGEFLEWEEVHGYLYGTPKAETGEIVSNILFDVDIKGALSLKKFHPKTTLIFIQPPSLEVLEERLEARGTEDQEGLKKRLDRFRLEMATKDKFDYVIINDDVESAVAELEGIVSREVSALK